MEGAEPVDIHATDGLLSRHGSRKPALQVLQTYEQLETIDKDLLSFNLHLPLNHPNSQLDSLGPISLSIVAITSLGLKALCHTANLNSIAAGDREISQVVTPGGGDDIRAAYVGHRLLSHSEKRIRPLTQRHVFRHAEQLLPLGT